MQPMCKCWRRDAVQMRLQSAQRSYEIAEALIQMQEHAGICAEAMEHVLGGVIAILASAETIAAIRPEAVLVSAREQGLLGSESLSRRIT